MKRRDFVQHLERHNCHVRREGAEHTVYENPLNGKVASVPRHNEIKTPTLRKVCKILEIPIPVAR